MTVEKKILQISVRTCRHDDSVQLIFDCKECVGDAINDLVVEEREACAKIAENSDSVDVFFGEEHDPQGRETQTCHAIAQAIRSRK